MRLWQRTRMTVAMLCLAALLPGYLSWKRGTLYGPPEYSPNRRYYVQKYHNVSLSSLVPAMPGGGSDAFDGYVRCYDRDGQLLHERFQTYLNGVDVQWAGDKVYLGGSEYNDSHPWQLPTHAE